MAIQKHIFHKLDCAACVVVVCLFEPDGFMADALEQSTHAANGDIPHLRSRYNIFYLGFVVVFVSLCAGGIRRQRRIIAHVSRAHARTLCV